MSGQRSWRRSGVLLALFCFSSAKAATVFTCPKIEKVQPEVTSEPVELRDVTVTVQEPVAGSYEGTIEAPKTPLTMLKEVLVPLFEEKQGLLTLRWITLQTPHTYLSGISLQPVEVADYGKASNVHFLGVRWQQPQARELLFEIPQTGAGDAMAYAPVGTQQVSGRCTVTAQ